MRRDATGTISDCLAAIGLIAIRGHVAMRVTLSALWLITVGASAQPIAHDWLIVPGERVGPISASTSEAALRAAFGPSNIAGIEVDLGEGFSEPGTAIYPDDDLTRLEVVWLDSSRSVPKEVRLNGDASLWRTEEGISLGSTLQDIERRNGFPFRLAGFAFDYGGTITDCGHGRLTMLGCDGVPSSARRIVLRLSPSVEARSYPEYRQVIGDREFSSGHPAMQVLNPGVYQMIVLIGNRAGPGLE